jgi:VCBS repeat-containing protein
VSAALGVLNGDFDVDSATLSAVLLSGPAHGSLTLNADGSYSYAAAKGALPAKIVAQDTFSYTVSDPHGGTDTANLYVVVFNPGTNYISGINTTLNGDNGPDRAR